MSRHYWMNSPQDEDELYYHGKSKNCKRTNCTKQCFNICAFSVLTKTVTRVTTMNLIW